MPTNIVLTERTRETHAALLGAARSVFEEEGYDGASVSQVVDRAGVSRGTFYIYFESKEDILQTIAEQIESDIQSMQTGIDQITGDEATRAAELIRSSTRRFLRFYRDNAKMMAVLEQVATHHPLFKHLRLRMRRSAAFRAIGLIERLQGSGLVPDTVNARYAAVALTGMVDRFAYVWFILEDDFDEDTAVGELSRLWFQAVSATPIAPAPAPPS